MKRDTIVAIPGTLLGKESVHALMQHPSLAPARWLIEPCGRATTLDEECARFVALAKSLDEPIVWVGHSLGGIVALNIAVRFAPCCRAVITLASTARDDAPENALKRGLQLESAYRAGTPAPVSLELKPAFGVNPGSDLGISLMRQADAIGVEGFANQTHYALERPDLRAAVAINSPILAIAGENDDICPPDRSAEIASLSNRGRCKVIESAGHLFPMTHAEKTAELISNFLTHLD